MTRALVPEYCREFPDLVVQKLTYSTLAFASCAPTSGNLVMVVTDTGAMYRETLLTAGIGACDPDTGFSSSGSGGGSLNWLLLSMLMLIGVVRYRTGPISA